LRGADPAPELDAAEIGRIFRAEYGRCVATLIRVFGDIDFAEDAVQDAFVEALRRWPRDGLPPNPGGWITTTARNRAIDGRRRASRGRQLLSEVAALTPGNEDPLPEEVGPVHDDRLRLIFTCCHPALSTEAQVALTLRLLGGLTTDEVARAFLVAVPTMAQRLTRAKRKIKAAQIPFRVPQDHDLPERVRAVLTVIYLIYNTGAESPAGGHRPSDDLRGEAIRLVRLLVALMPDEPEAAGLLALLLLTESRRAARFAPDGSLVLLRDQDRGRWDRVMIAEGQTIVRACLRHNQPGPYQLQAAINAVHADADSVEATDWSQVVALYDQLLAVAPTPVVALNRAIAVSEVDGPGAVLALVDGLGLDGYYAYHATRADLLRRLNRPDEAANAYQTAALLAPTVAERDFLARQARRHRHPLKSRDTSSE
jgi:RNA polymerase sigma-70 factor (ECF subfamily)